MEAALTNSEFIILGLVAEEPKYGYQIEQDIARRGMREWTEIGFSSIYFILNKLENRLLLSSEKRSEGDRPARKIYTLTGQGWKVYHDEVFIRITQPRLYTEDFDLGLANFLILDSREFEQAIRSYQKTLTEKMMQVKEKYELDGGKNLPMPARALFDHSIAIMTAELEWVKDALKKFSESGEN